jgi:hypothetical protein
MDFFKKNYETIKSLAIIIGAVCYLHHYMDSKFEDMNQRFSSIETRLTKIETVLIMNGMMHPSLAKTAQHPDTPSKSDGSF